MLLGLIRPTSGRVRLFGAEPGPGSLAKVGALIEGPAFHPYLSGGSTCGSSPTTSPMWGALGVLPAIGLRSVALPIGLGLVWLLAGCRAGRRIRAGHRRAGRLSGLLRRARRVAAAPPRHHLMRGCRPPVR
ncbi:hypothetical protein [Amycolatopsis sp. NPDC051128]|uniref:hypothetical protein n=1 Tax=Amycolatopsis sp. NPDC051128 TaxID=3155412 RepID=UPI00342F7CB7